MSSSTHPEIIEEIYILLSENKAFNIIALDVSQVCTFASYFFIAEGLVERHLTALVEKLTALLKKQKIIPSVSGIETDWVVLDTGFIVLHLMLSPIRQYYALDQLWNKGKRLHFEEKG